MKRPVKIVDSKLTVWLFRMIIYPLIFLIPLPGCSTMYPSSVWPEYWHVAPRILSISDPKRPTGSFENLFKKFSIYESIYIPDIPPNRIIGYWGVIQAFISLLSTKSRVQAQCEKPTNNPPNRLKNNPSNVIPPFVPFGTFLPVVIKIGSLFAMTGLNSDANVSPQQHANELITPIPKTLPIKFSWKSIGRSPNIPSINCVKAKKVGKPALQRTCEIFKCHRAIK